MNRFTEFHERKMVILFKNRNVIYSLMYTTVEENNNWNPWAIFPMI